MQSIRMNAAPLPDWDKTCVLCRDCIYFRPKSLMNSQELCMNVVEVYGGDRPEVIGDNEKLIGCSQGVHKGRVKQE